MATVGEKPNFREVPFEELHQGSEERNTLGIYFPKGGEGNPYPEENIVAVREKTLGSTMETRYSSRVIPRIQNVIEHGTDFEGLEIESTFATLEQRIMESMELLHNDPRFTEAIKRTVINHETTHAAISRDEPEYEALVTRYHSLLNSKYIPRRDFRRLIFGRETMTEMTCYLSQLGGLDAGPVSQGIINSFVLDKAVYPFLPGFDRYLDNCDNGALETYEPNVFGCLSIIIGDPSLVEKIWSGEIDADTIRQRTAASLTEALENPQGFISERTKPEFVEAISAVGKQYANEALEERDRLVAKGELHY